MLSLNARRVHDGKVTRDFWQSFFVVKVYRLLYTLSVNPKTAQRRAEILGEMNEIELMEAGKICEMRRERTSGPARIYLNHQHWKDGANHSCYVKAGPAEALKAAIKNRQRFEQLAGEFVEITVADTRKAAAGSKKNSARKSVRRNTAKPKRS